MLPGAKTFLSKAWSGASMVAGANAMMPVVVKSELPDDPDALRMKIQEHLRKLDFNGSSSFATLWPCEDLRRRLNNEARPKPAQEAAPMEADPAILMPSMLQS